MEIPYSSSVPGAYNRPISTIRQAMSEAPGADSADSRSSLNQKLAAMDLLAGQATNKYTPVEDAVKYQSAIIVRITVRARNT